VIPAVELRTAWLRGLRAGLKSGEPALVGESWAEDDPALPRLEARTIGWLVGRWRRLRDECLDVLGLRSAAKSVTSGAFTFTVDELIDIVSRSQAFAAEVSGPDGQLVRAFLTAWARGWVNAGRQIDDASAVADALAAVRASIANRGLELVRGGVARTFRDGIVAELSSGALDGMNPVNVARHLRQRFGAGEYNWERLARTEIAIAQADGKLEHYRQAGITAVDYITAGDDRVREICNTLAERSPYPIHSAPVPGRDSHPGCRCSVVARIPD